MKHSSTSRLPVVVGVLGLVLGGCSSVLEPRPDPTKFFTLTPLSERKDTPGTGEKIMLGVGPITFPTYLKRRDMVTRVTANELQVNPYDRWAGPLPENFAAVLSDNLATLLASGQVVTFPWYNNTLLDYSVEIDVLRFEADTAGNTTLSARWSVKDGADGKLLIAKRSTLTGSAGAGGTEAAVGALNESLGELSRRIATAVQQLHEPRKG